MKMLGPAAGMLCATIATLRIVTAALALVATSAPVREAVAGAAELARDLSRELRAARPGDVEGSFMERWASGLGGEVERDGAGTAVITVPLDGASEPDRTWSAVMRVRNGRVVGLRVTRTSRQAMMGT